MSEKRFSFISELTEGRMIKSKSKLQGMSGRDIVDLFFLHICALEILKNDYEYAPKVQKYAKQSMRFQKFDRFIGSGTDFYLLAYAVSTQDESIFTDERDKVFIKRTNLDDRQLKRYLERIALNRFVFEEDRRFTLKLNYDLQINSSYRAIRRLAIEWTKINSTQKKLAITRLLQAFRKKGLMSDLYPWLANMAKKDSLELQGVFNPETGKQEPGNPGSSWKKKLAVAGAVAVGTYVGAKYLKGRRETRRKERYGS